jgi:hypothetical protein
VIARLIAADEVRYNLQESRKRRLMLRSSNAMKSSHKPSFFRIPCILVQHAFAGKSSSAGEMAARQKWVGAADRGCGILANERDDVCAVIKSTSG